MARLFALHGVDVTILITSHNATIFQKSIDLDFSRGRSIRTHLIEFPASKKDAASKLGIPRIMFHGASYLARSATHSVEQYAPHLKAEFHTDKFIIPDLPHKLEMTRLQLPDWLRSPNQYTELMRTIKKTKKRGYGSLFNSFYELEGAYYEHYKKVLGTKSWGLGLVSLWANQDASYKAARGQAKAEGEEEEGWLKWLNSKPESSILYVSFGSMNKFPYSQLVEIANALEDSGYDFLWVVRKNERGGEEDGSLEEFQKRVKESNRGFLIWGWAPQLLILENKAVGGLVTHCGWNTVVESVNARLPMATLL
ncbi:UDP-glucuronosyl/UDP-glucosyltransferase [Sesbania bispinosa]|nr:UDP-glucuronosyl/UDP-glucosyltransferase [Sesbania bispinosa]